MTRSGKVWFFRTRSGQSLPAKDYWVYILTSRDNKVMYVGVTKDLVRRLHEHKMKLRGGFTAKCNVHRLVYFESTPSVEAAISREKQIKGWSRAKKNALVAATNPDWKDLSEEWGRDR